MSLSGFVGFFSDLGFFFAGIVNVADAVRKRRFGFLKLESKILKFNCKNNSVRHLGSLIVYHNVTENALKESWTWFGTKGSPLALMHSKIKCIS